MRLQVSFVLSRARKSWEVVPLAFDLRLQLVSYIVAMKHMVLVKVASLAFNMRLQLILLPCCHKAYGARRCSCLFCRQQDRNRCGKVPTRIFPHNGQQ